MAKDPRIKECEELKKYWEKKSREYARMAKKSDLDPDTRRAAEIVSVKLAGRQVEIQDLTYQIVSLPKRMPIVAKVPIAGNRLAADQVQILDEAESTLASNRAELDADGDLIDKALDQLGVPTNDYMRGERRAGSKLGPVGENAQTNVEEDDAGSECGFRRCRTAFRFEVERRSDFMSNTIPR